MRDLAGALEVPVGFFSAPWPAPGDQAPVTYFYDGLGRLAGVVNGNGESAVYVYDAVGNLLAIERHSSGTVGIVQFTPSGGPIATTVTISGTGFSTTPSQNTLTFNGVAATVTGATALLLLVASVASIARRRLSSRRRAA